MPEQPYYHAERRLGVVALPVQFCAPVRPMRSEVRHALVRRLRMRGKPRVLLYPMIRSRPVPEGDLQALLAVVSGVGETPLRDDIVWKVIPYLLEPLTLVNVRLRERVAEYEERVDLDRRVRLDPVLDGPDPVVRLPPGVVPSAVACRVRRDDDLPPRKERQDVRMEALPDDEPTPALVLQGEVRVVRDLIDIEVLREERKHAFRVAEGRLEQLPDEEGDKEGPFFDRRSAGASPMLPKREPVRMFPDRLQAHPHPADHDVVVAAQPGKQRFDVYSVRVHPRLAGKLEYPARHFYFGGAHPETSLKH